MTVPKTLNANASTLSPSSDAAVETFDRPTIYALAAMCYFVAMMMHEAVGHGGTTLLLGGRVIQITSAECACDTSALSPWATRAVAADGCVANVVTGLLVLWIGSRLPRERSLSRYAAWLFGHLSIFIAAGYLMVFPFLPAGDWHDFVAGLSAPIAWKLALTVLGIVGYVMTMNHARAGLEEFLGGEPSNRRARVRHLTLVPYLIGGTLETLSSIVGGGGILTFISAAPATFGGTIGLPFSGARALRSRHEGDARTAAPAMPRAPIVIAVGVVVALIQLFWFGPGLLHRF